MEMNTRIQVEHPVTEEVTGEDLIEWQIRVAAGEKITGGNHTPQGHSIECRINAEDPYRDFAPSPGPITAFHSPKGRGVRCDTHVFAGYTVPPTYDSMIAKLIVHDTDRPRAIDKMRRALDEFVVEGIKTTVPFHKQLLARPALRGRRLRHHVPRALRRSRLRVTGTRYGVGMVTGLGRPRTPHLASLMSS